MGKHILLPALALGGGAVGFALRKWQLSTAFEAESGLAIPGAPAALILALWSALLAAALLFLCRGARSGPDAGSVPDGRGNRIFLTAGVLAAFLLLSGGVADFVAGDLALRTLPGMVLAKGLSILRSVLTLLGFPCALLWVRALYRDPDSARESLPLLELWLTVCVWLIADYQHRAGDPIVMAYAYEMLAIAAVLMALYYLAGFVFQTGKPFPMLWFSLMGIYFSLVTLADGHTLGDLARYGFCVLFLCAHVYLFLAPRRGDDHPTEEEREENPNE